MDFKNIRVIDKLPIIPILEEGEKALIKGDLLKDFLPNLKDNTYVLFQAPIIYFNIAPYEMIGEHKLPVIGSIINPPTGIIEANIVL